MPLNGVAPGSPVRARLARPLHDGDQVVLPEGTIIAAQVVAVEKQSLPMPVLEVGLSVSHPVADGGVVPLTGTMVHAEPAKGLVLQQKRLLPRISEKGKTEAGILVRRVEAGQCIPQWDPRHASIPRGFHTRWRIELQ